MNWQDTIKALSLLSYKIIDKPHVIVAVVRGGLIPARILSSNLTIKDMYCLTVKKHGSDRRVVTQVTEPLTGVRVLLVEDVLETGTSLIAAKEYLESKGAVVETAALYIQPRSQIIPDYYLEIREQVPTFPWE
jgi:hypoxanthine phosphoribosyltransferase